MNYNKKHANNANMLTSLVNSIIKSKCKQLMLTLADNHFYQPDYIAFYKINEHMCGCTYSSNCA